MVRSLILFRERRFGEMLVRLKYQGSFEYNYAEVNVRYE